MYYYTKLFRIFYGIVKLTMFHDFLQLYTAGKLSAN